MVLVKDIGNNLNSQQKLFRIILAGDDENSTNRIRRLLDYSGFEYICTDQLDEIFRSLELNPDSLLILDNKIPEYSFQEVVEQIRSNGYSPPFVILVDESSVKDAVQMMKMGARDYIVKDQQTLEILINVVEQELVKDDADKHLTDTEEALLQRAYELAALHATTLDITTTHQLPALLEKIVKRAVRLLDGTGGGLYLCEAEKEEVLCVVSFNSSHDKKGKVLKYGQGTIGKVAQDGVPNIQKPVHPIDGTVNSSLRQPLFSASIIAPMKWQNSVTGLVRVISDTEDRQFNRHDLDFLTMLANQASIAVENTRLLNEAKKEIKERMTAESALRESEKKYRMLVENQNELVIKSDTHGRLTYVCPKYCETFGKSEAELIGHKFKHQIHKDDREKAAKSLEIVFDHPYSSYHEERAFTLNGWQWFAWSDKALLDDAGNVQEIIAVGRDITEIKQAEKELQNLNAELTHYVELLQRRNTEVTIVNEMGDMLQSCPTVEDAYTVICDYVEKLFPRSIGGLYIFTKSRDYLELVTSWGKQSSLEVVFEPGDCWALRRNKIHQLSSPKDRLLCKHVQKKDNELNFYPYMCVPLIGPDMILGLFHISSHTIYESSESRNLILTVAERIALSISNLCLQEKLHEQTIRDPLTGVFNRRYMEKTLERELSRAVRHKGKLGILMIDVDNLKSTNDEYGHGAGDVLLRELGTFLSKNTRQEDIVCRYGGDEFIIVLNESSLEGAYKRAQILQQGIKDLQLHYSDVIIRDIQVSIGVACYPEHSDNVDTLMEYADNALYQAKNKGRDQVVLARICHHKN
jgi:diguanylate cyclase (GGDEF)-like protein/PAS domain S-box-containing protein